MGKEKQFEDDYRDFIELLNKHGVEYLIIGAYAVMYHTRVARGTKDIDLWIRHSKENSKKCALAIKDFAGIDVKPDELIGEKEIYFIGVEPHRIDIFNRQGRFSFDEMYKRKVVADFRDVKACFVSQEDLLVLKNYFYRKDDLKDIRRLVKSKNKY
ncbi:MAG: nucleotidyltransferase [Deltaproteobacteria bacterium]|nr:nucleotidyltransferase [Deltaproteobacteria bacterium]MCL5276180.1 nucleotidyltransferase [Deltaproteobacteria bacterium]